MDDLARDFGFRPQGKSAPMVASKSTVTGGGSGSGTLNFGISSEIGDGVFNKSSSSNKGRSGWNSNPVSGGFNSFMDDHDGLFTGKKTTYDNGGGGGVGGGYDDVFGGPPKYNSKPSSFDYGSIFHGESVPTTTTTAKSSSLPVYDKPVYDDDIFEGIPGLKNTSSSAKYEDVFSSSSSPPPPAKQVDIPLYDDFLGKLGKPTPEFKKNSSDKKDNDFAFDDLIPGFGRSNPPQPPKDRVTTETNHVHQSTVPSTKGASGDIDDPFVGLESTSTPVYASSGLFTNPLEEISKASNSGATKVNIQSSSGLFDDMDPLGSLGKSVPSFSTDMDETAKDKNSQKTGPNKVDTSPRSEDNLDAADDIWLSVSEIPLYTQPTSAPPPSRPPPRPVQFTNGGRATSSKKVNDYSSHNFTHNFENSESGPDSVKSPGVSSIDELEDFAMGKPRNNADEHGDVLSSEEESELNSAAAASAAAMKEAMDRAQAKFKHGKEVRERDNIKAAKNRVNVQQEHDEKVMQEAREQELREKQERLDFEREQREIEQRKIEKERERAREIERERQRARQAVEQATREARDRAAAAARQKAERIAVEKVNIEARERAERQAVQRAQAEARDRAQAEARERAERDKAAAARAEAEVRLRAQKAAVERAAAEARERAAAGARERAAAAARSSQQKNEPDLESFFGSMDARPSSAPKSRTTTSNSMFDAQFQNKAGPEVAQQTSSGASSSMRKASSATNIVEELFGGGLAPSSGDFQEIDGETEERRRARLVRHQRTQERAIKALAEKNERDLQSQREQAEKHRIGETLDIEIKRWAAGKETNLRALLSTLQYVLWPECGWQPVSLTDLITGASVKKVYRKATLCIHPDKVQQKGANIQQKYIAEKVFDLLKEAWNKFNSEELF